jgi:osmotically-inducible protein OsmY
MEEIPMASERGERRFRDDDYPRRGESERYRRDRGRDEEYYGPFPDDEGEYVRPAERRHWRGHDYYGDDEFERGRRYGDYDQPTDRPLRAEHRERFLRRGESDERSSRYIGSGAGAWRGGQGWNDERSGPYAGRGPKGYHRSDERVHEDICERLTEHPSIDASDIEVSVSSGDVTLNGNVESRAVKHLTEVMVETVPGVKDIHNQLRVVPREGGFWSGANEERYDSRAEKVGGQSYRRS